MGQSPGRFCGETDKAKVRYDKKALDRPTTLETYLDCAEIYTCRGNQKGKNILSGACMPVSMHEPTSCWLLLYMRRNFELDFQTLCWLDTYIYELIDTGHES